MGIIVDFPDHLPILTSGAGDAAAGRACAMSAVHWMEGGAGNSDAPKCVHPFLRHAFVAINDTAIWDDDAHRTRTLWPLIARAMGTAETGTAQQQHVLAVRLALFSARYALPYVNGYQAACRDALDVLQRWCEGTATEKECRTACNAFALVIPTKHYDRIFSLIANTLYAVNDEPSSILVHDLLGVIYRGTAQDNKNVVAYLTALLNEYDRLTNRVSKSTANLRGLDRLVPTLSVN